MDPSCSPSFSFLENPAPPLDIDERGALMYMRPVDE